MTNPWTAVSIAAFVVNLALGIYVLSRNPKGAANRTFALLMGSFVLWDLGEAVLRYMSNGAVDHDMMMFWLRVEWTGISACGGVLVHFVLSYPATKRILEWKPAYVLIYAPTFLTIGLVWATDLVVHDIVMGPFGYQGAVGAGYTLLATIYAIQLWVAIAILVRTYIKSEVPIIKKGSQVLLIGVLVSVVPGSTTEVLMPIFVDTPTRLGTGSIYTLVLAIFSAYAIMRYKLLVIEPAVEGTRPARKGFKARAGHNNLVESGDSSHAYNAFRDIVAETPGLVITTRYPEKIRRRYGLEKTPILWISKTSSGETTFKPASLNFEVSQTTMNFIRDNPRTAVLLDDLEYLIEVAGFEEALRFVKILTDVGSANDSTIIVTVNPSALEEKSLFVIRGTFDSVKDMSGPAAAPGGALGMRLVNCILYLDGKQKCYDRFKRELAGKKGLFVTITHPRKVRSKLGVRNVKFIWLSETEGTPGSLDPSALKYEGLREVGKFVEAHPSHVILFEGAEYLTSSLSFPEVVDFIQSVIDLTSAKETVFLVPVDPKAFGKRDLGILERRFDEVVK